MPLFVVVACSLSLALGGCGGTDAADPTPSSATQSADATGAPAPELPPYETELNLTAEEKVAADEAYELMVDFWNADSIVKRDPGNNPDQSLQFTHGKMFDDFEEGYANMAEAGERGVGVMNHSYFRLVEIELEPGGESSAVSVFDSCQDYDAYDLLDASGESLRDYDITEYAVVYRVEKISSGWKFVNVEFLEPLCD